MNKREARYEIGTIDGASVSCVKLLSMTEVLRRKRAFPSMLAALRGALSHNAALKPEFKLPESLVREMEAAIKLATES